MKLSKKNIEEITNKLHYDGELLKIKKQININEDNENKSKKCNFSEEKLTYSSIIILIKKLLFEYCTTIANNVYVDYTENPKLNYDQYIDVFKDLYYIERDALPDDYLEEDTIYKELWNKLILFSSGPENSLESNVLLLYLLELNGFFSNDKIIKELKNEINWIKLEDYDDLIANAKYIEENWRDLKTIKIEYIKRLKLEGKYNPKHCQELYNKNSKNNRNQILNINITNNDDKNHYITTLKGNTNYHLIHGYSKKSKNSENNSLFDFTNLFNENEENKHSSLNISNISNKNNKNNENNNTKNRIPLKDSYKDLIIKKKVELENKKKDEEAKLKEICTFKPKINSVNKKIFSKKIKIELQKYKQNKSVNKYNNSNSIITQENNNSNINNNLNQNNISIYNQQKNDQINNNKKNNKNNLKRNKSSLQKMFKDNPLKKDKAYIEKIEKIKMAKLNGKEFENYKNNLVPPMRFDIEYPSKFENLGIIINRDANLRQRANNVIFYNIKVNEKMKILKYNEGDDLKLNIINFVRKNNLPEEVIDIILTKIKEKAIEEIL
jgi:hypothetical protein